MLEKLVLLQLAAKVLSDTKVGDTICDANNVLKEALPG